MPPVDRLKPIRAASSESGYSLIEFMREYPDDATCLEWLWRTRFSPDGETAHCPKCDQDRTFKRYECATRRQSWTCTGCGHHVHPTAGTIFEKSSTSLHLWFYAMYLMASTRCGISAKQLERELGVRYKTAWRMFNKIRNQLMAQDGEMRPPVIEGLTFEGCHILGPAVLVLRGEGSLVEVTFEDNADGIFWQLVPEQTQLVGAILVTDCHFKRCRFAVVGFADTNREFRTRFEAS